MAEKPLSLQDHFLNSVRRSKTPVTIFLVKGVKLQGVITWFDVFSLLLRRDGGSQLIYKHSISTIMPGDMPADFSTRNDALKKAPAAPGGRVALQDLFLGAAQRDRADMTVFLVNGVMLQGAVAGFDQFSLLLERGGSREQVQLVYKHAISTLQPPHSLDLEPEKDGTDETSTDRPTEKGTGKPTDQPTGMPTDESTDESTEASTKGDGP